MIVGFGTLLRLLLSISESGTEWDLEKVNVMKGFGRAPLGCCCSAFSARRCGTATPRPARPAIPNYVKYLPPLGGAEEFEVLFTLTAQLSHAEAQQRHGQDINPATIQLSLFSVPCYPCPCVPGHQGISTAWGSRKQPRYENTPTTDIQIKVSIPLLIGLGARGRGLPTDRHGRECALLIAASDSQASSHSKSAGQVLASWNRCILRGTHRASLDYPLAAAVAVVVCPNGLRGTR